MRSDLLRAGIAAPTPKIVLKTSPGALSWNCLRQDSPVGGSRVNLIRKSITASREKSSIIATGSLTAICCIIVSMLVTPVSDSNYSKTCFYSFCIERK